jgi:uncharacterized protein (TIGR03792 family)
MSDDSRYSYVKGEKRPVEILVFKMDPSVVDQFLEVDHQVWTLGEAATHPDSPIPFVSKEVWLDDSRPGEVTLVFIWDTLDHWLAVGDKDIQDHLQAQFDARFPHPIELIAAPHEDSNLGIHRWSRFERK